MPVLPSPLRETYLCPQLVMVPHMGIPWVYYDCALARGNPVNAVWLSLILLEFPTTDDASPPNKNLGKYHQFLVLLLRWCTTIGTEKPI